MKYRGRGRMIIILLLFLSAPLAAQFYEYGQDAGNLRWSQIQAPNYRVIFPRGSDSVALTFTRHLESYYSLLGKDLHHNHSPIPVIIHNESSFANGASIWAPKRLEIFSNPDPNGYNQDWLTQLAIHEGRHVVQIDKLNQGFTRGLYFLGGEQFVGAMAVFLPYWYLEGDAVDAETRLSHGGRGRLPSFEMGLKAQMLGLGETYSFSKATMGSYRDYIPNHYELGYLMVRYGRRSYGDQFWVDFQDAAARLPFVLNPGAYAMRKYGLKSKKVFYEEALGFYRDHWAGMDSLRILSPFRKLSADQRHYSNFQFGHALSASSLIARKSGMDIIPELVRIDSAGNEKRLFRPGYSSSDRITVSGDLVVWDEFVPDRRWSNRNFSVVKSYNLNTGRIRSLGKRTRLYAPALSKDAGRIAAVRQSEFQQYSLVILDTLGRELGSYASPGNLFIQHPAWMDDGERVILIMSRGSQKSLVACRLSDASWTVLFEGGNEDMSHPVHMGDLVCFSATYSGIDNIYGLQLSSGNVFRLTSSRFGASQPQFSIDGESLIYSDYGAGGRALVSMELDDALWEALGDVKSHQEQVDYAIGPDEEAIRKGISKADSLQLEIRPYRKLSHLVNLHSWLPLYVDYLNPSLSLNPEQLPVSPGLSLISQNHLSTAVSQLAYEYNDGFHYFHSGIQLKGRYPVLNLYFDYGGEPNIQLLNEAGDSAMALPTDMRFSAESFIPFRLNTGKYLSLIQPGIEYQFSRDIQYLEDEQRYRSGIHYLHYSLYATSYLRKGRRDIWPRFGLTMNGGFFHAAGDNRLVGGVSYGSFYLYVPGLLKHQSLRLSGHRQQQYPLDPQRPAYINLISLPRGMQRIYGERLTRYSADYTFPIVYPDFGSLLYIQRIRANLWFDYMIGEDVIFREPEPHVGDRDFSAVGFDLWFDFNLLRIPFPISLGGRFGWEDFGQDYFFDLLFSIDIN
jgi:hypothetical protein